MPAGGSKDERGSVLIVAGARDVPGAAILAGTSALRAGAGKLQIATCASVAIAVGVSVPEALVMGVAECADGAMDPQCGAEICARARKVRAMVYGPGMTQGDGCVRLLGEILRGCEVPMIVDAAGIVAASRQRALVRSAGRRIAITPHAGEMAALLEIPRERVEAQPHAIALEAARTFECVVALKGAHTFIATPDGESYCNRAGSIGLATSGSGDTLAGIAGGLLARGLPPLAATVWAVYAHARAGAELNRSIGMGFLAREIPEQIPKQLRRLNASV